MSPRTKSPMKRKDHQAHVREKIIKTTRRLLMKQGYESTTIRQITKECEVQIGTVYHFFKNKEEIFSFISESLFERVVKKAEEGIDPQDTTLIYAREIRLHLNIIFNDEKSRELYLVSYNSPLILKGTQGRTARRNRELFSKYSPAFSELDYFVRACFINGCIQSLAVQAPEIDRDDIPQIIHNSIRLMLLGFNVPLPTINRTMEQLDAS